MHILKIPAPFLAVGLWTMVLGHPGVGEEGRNAGIKIVGGNETKPHEYPSIVGIYIRRIGISGSILSLSCGGSIINANWIITAAECTLDSLSSYEIVAGDHNVRKEEGTEQRRSVIQIIRHKKYYSTVHNNIALMRVSSPFLLNAEVGVAELPHKGYTVDGNIVAIGWGTLGRNGKYPDVLQHVLVPFVNDAKCRAAYGQSWISDSMMCAGHPEGGKGTCLAGDTGGPLNHNGMLVGLILVEYFCAESGYPGIYTEVSYYIDWIREALASN